MILRKYYSHQTMSLPRECSAAVSDCFMDYLSRGCRPWPLPSFIFGHTHVFGLSVIRQRHSHLMTVPCGSFKLMELFYRQHTHAHGGTTAKCNMSGPALRPALGENKC